nr:hypothetical protein [Pandoravirus massiliensis]
MEHGRGAASIGEATTHNRATRVRKSVAVNLRTRLVEPTVGMALKTLTIVAKAPPADDAPTVRIGRIASLGSIRMGLAPALSVDVTEETVRQYAFNARLSHAEEAIDAAEVIFRLATARIEPPSVPASLVAALRDNCRVFPLRKALVDAVLAGGDAAVNQCLAIALRVEALGRSYTQMRKKVRARSALGPVSAWLLRIANGSAYVATPTAAAALAVVHVAESDLWMPVIDIARAAGQTCSMPLLERACAEIKRRADQHTHVLANGRRKEWQLRRTTRRERRDHEAISMIVLGAFAKGLAKPADGMPPQDCMAMCRGPVLTLVRKVRSSIKDVHASDSINRARATLASAIDSHHTNRHDALAYMLGTLTSFAVESTGWPRIRDDVPLRRIAFYLADPTNPSHALALKGLDIFGGHTDYIAAATKPDTVSNPVDSPSPHAQTDLLTALHGHHPDLFIDVLAHVNDSWDIGSIALTSRTHYAHLIQALRKDDAVGTARRLRGVAFSGTLWLQRHVDSLVYDPVAQLITPPSAQETLPYLRLLLFLCRPMAVHKTDGPRGMWSTDGTKWDEVMAAACVLDCGDVVAHCIARMGLAQRTDALQNRNRHINNVEWLAEKAGFYGSPLMLHVAITESLGAMHMTEHGPDYARARPIRHIRSLVDEVVRGILGGLEESESQAYRFCRTGHSPRHRRRLDGLPALVDILCAFLKGVRRDMDTGRMDIVDATYGIIGFRCAAMAVLAPGVCLPLPQVRTRLALALFEAAKPVWTEGHAVDSSRSAE